MSNETCTMELAKFIIPGSGVLVLWWALFHGHEANTDESFNNCVSSMQCKYMVMTSKEAFTKIRSSFWVGWGGGGHTALFRGKYTLIIQEYYLQLAIDFRKVKLHFVRLPVLKFLSSFLGSWSNLHFGNEMPTGEWRCILVGIIFLIPLSIEWNQML